MFDLIHTLAAGSALFLAFLVAVARRDENRLANRWLAVFLLVLGIFILDDSLLVYGIYATHPWMIGWAGLLIFAMAPALFLCVSQFTAVEKRFRWSQIWHFTPYFLFVVLSLPFLLLASPKMKLNELGHETITLEEWIILSLVVLQMAIYLFLSFQKLKKHRHNIENLTASPTETNLDWLFYSLAGITIMVLVWCLELFGGTIQVHAGWYSIVYMTGIYTLGYFAMRQKEVFPFSPAESAALVDLLTEADTPLSTRRQVLQEERLGQLKNALLQKMDIEKPYLDPELSLPVLARQMDLSLHELSELINTGFGENFSRFINRYRVEESKRLLLSDRHTHLSMVGIAFEAGFNSKTAFNTVFKKMTGISPSEFRQRD